MEAFHSNAASERETMANKLYEASVRGDVQALDALMEKDELILDRVSLTCFDETPAHIAAMRGHVDFMRVLLSHMPKLASHLDSLGRSPLHVACAEGHADIVCELLGADNGVCRVHDEDGRTPLHLAVAKGQVEVIRELLGAISRRVESTSERVQVLKGGGEGESVLHLCVKYNRSKALKLVVEWMRRSVDDDGEHDSIINSKDKDGNTILHLAAALKQKETIEYLLQIPSVKAVTNSKNQNGFTALDVLEVYPIRDLKSMEIRDILQLAGVQRAHSDNQLLEKTPTDHHHLESPPPVTTRTTTTAKIISKAKQLISNTWKTFFMMDNKWLEEARGNLIMSASVIAAMAFQGALSPPGDVWQDFNNADDNGIHLQPGTSIAGSCFPETFNYFLIPNTVSLIASLSTILLAISGFPLKNRLAIWLLMTAMCTSVASMALAYLFAIMMVLPNNSWASTYKFYNGVFYTWLGLCGLVMLIHTIRFFTWLFERRPRFFRKKSIAKLLKYESLDRV